jgi:hypothetical protein
MQATNNNAPTPGKDQHRGAKSDGLVLLDAIDSISLHRARKVLIELCTESPQARQFLCDKLLVGHGQTSSKDDTEAGPKRKRDAQQRYEICKQCEEEYDILNNSQDACAWHPGKLSSVYNTSRNRPDDLREQTCRR